MDTMTFCVPCLFGLEGLVGDELRRLDLQNVRVEDRRVLKAISPLWQRLTSAAAWVSA